MSNEFQGKVASEKVGLSNVDLVGNQDKSMGVIPRLLLILSILGLYLQFSYVFPYSLFIACGALLAMGHCIRRPKFLLPAVVLTAVAALSILGSIAAGTFEQGQIDSLGLLALSALASTGVALGVSQLGSDAIGKGFWFLSVGLIVGALFEVLGPLKPISDAVRQIIYPLEIVYSNDDRDIRLFEFIRPKFFTSEPSHLGKFLTIFIVISAMHSRKQVKHVLAGLVGYFVIASPVLLLAVIFPMFLGARLYGFRRLLNIPFAPVAAALALCVIVYFLVEISVFRLGLLGGTVEPSAFLRVIRPLIMLGESLSSSPLLGVGLGADEPIRQLANSAMLSAPSTAFIRQHLYSHQDVLGSALVTTLIYFGVFGGALWLFGLRLIQRVFGGDAVNFWLFFFSYSFFLGSINTPLYLAPLYLLSIPATHAVQTRRHQT